MKPEKDQASQDKKKQKVMEKGNCLECAHYHDCPRMKGINHCYNMHVVHDKDAGQEAPPPDPKT